MSDFNTVKEFVLELGTPPATSGHALGAHATDVTWPVVASQVTVSTLLS